MLPIIAAFLLGVANAKAGQQLPTLFWDWITFVFKVIVPIVGLTAAAQLE